MENSEISEIFIFCSKSYQNLSVFVSAHFLTFLNLEFHSVSEFEVNKWQNGKWKKIKPQKSWKYYSKFSYFPVFNFAVRSKSKLGFKYLWKKNSNISKVSDFLNWPCDRPERPNYFSLYFNDSWLYAIPLRVRSHTYFRHLFKQFYYYPFLIKD